MTRRTPISLAFVAPLALLLATGCLARDGGGDTADGGTVTDGGDGGDVVVGHEGADYAGSCSDGVDNDNDGFTDCKDFACTSDPACETPDTLTIYDIQDVSSNFHPVDGDTVTVSGVVTGAKLNTKYNSWEGFIEDPQGGPFSGIMIMGSATEFAQGDAVTVTGTYTEYYDKSEIQVTTINVTASGATLPAPAVVGDPASIATGGADAEAYEGVLVEIQDVTVTNPAVPGSDGKPHGDYEVTGGLIVNPYWHTDYVPAQDDALQSLVGVLDYTFDAFRLLPRDNDDITFSDGSHPGGPGVSTTIQDIQDVTSTNHPAGGSKVTLTHAVVTATASKGFWIQQGTGEYSGIYVYCAGTCAPAVAVGDDVTVEATYSEYNDLSELSYATTTINSTGGTAPAPSVVDPTAFLSDGEPWEGVLVEIKGSADLTVADATADSYTADGVSVYGKIFNYVPANGDKLRSVVGVVDYYSGATVYQLLPRSGDDVTLADGSHPGATAPDTVTVQQIQDESAAGHPAIGNKVQVTGAVVTALKMSTSAPGTISGFWIQQGTGQYSGIYVYGTGGATPAVGDAVDVAGSTSEYNGLSEISADTVSVTGTGTLPTPDVIAPADLDAATGEPWEGVLVTMQATSGTMTVASVTSGSSPTAVVDGVTVYGRLYDFSSDIAANDALQSVTGVVDYYNAYQLLPRSAADLVK